MDREEPGVSRPYAYHLLGEAQESLGYERTFAPKRRERYKPVTKRRAEEEARREEEFEDFLDMLDPVELLNLKRLERAVTRGDEGAEARYVKRVQALRRQLEWRSAMPEPRLTTATTTGARRPDSRRAPSLTRCGRSAASPTRHLTCRCPSSSADSFLTMTRVDATQPECVGYRR